MDKQSERNESKLFISNMVESAIRIGLIFVLLMFTYDIIRPFILPVIWGAIIAVALLPLTKKLQRAYGGRRGLGCHDNRTAGYRTAGNATSDGVGLYRGWCNTRVGRTAKWSGENPWT